MIRRVLAACFLPVLISWSATAQVTPQVLVPGYGISRISDLVPSSSVTQMAFRSGDDAHLFVVQQPGSVLRYDYDPVTGTLSNAVTVATSLGTEALGLAFHGDDLYVSLNLGAGDGRITRLSNPDAGGVYQVRHDFVHSIPMGNHDVNQMQIVGDTLYVGIGAVGRVGDPAVENIYTMTIARIVDLTQVDFSGPIDPDFKGPINHLADATEWVNTLGTDGQLRYYASGFRNPFGIAMDTDGDVWISTNGNSDVGFLSFDYLYKKVPLGGQGDFPPPEFGFGAPHIVGTPIMPLTNLGQNPSPTGLDFVAAGPDEGAVVLAQAGASNQAQFPVGKDVLRVDPVSGAFEILVDDMNLPTDVVQDPFGRLLISDYLDDSLWVLTPPLPPAGRVPDGASLPGVPFTVDRLPGGDLVLSWGASCAPGDVDYEIYEGTLGVYYDHGIHTCTTGGATTTTLAPSAGGSYFLVVPTNTAKEGSYGVRGDGTERPQAASACLSQEIATLCP